MFRSSVSKRFRIQWLWAGSSFAIVGLSLQSSSRFLQCESPTTGAELRSNSPKRNAESKTSSAKEDGRNTEFGISDLADTKSSTTTILDVLSIDSLQTWTTEAWTSLTDTMEQKLADMPNFDILPDYAWQLPKWIDKIRTDTSFEEGRMGNEIWQEAMDPWLNPDIKKDASVRIGNSICAKEVDFLGRRKTVMKAALAAYIAVPESDIDEDDIPIIGIAGSGGGMRACIATTGYLASMQRTGLFDCTSYMAGVSGSTWAYILYFTLGRQTSEGVLSHLKRRIDLHIAYPPASLQLLSESPTNKYLLRGPLERIKAGYDDFGLVDVYGMMLAARLLVPRNELVLNDSHLKLSAQAKLLAHGQNPLPIYTAVRHEIPEKATREIDRESTREAKLEEAREKSWFIWYELTPFEFGSEEIGAWIPTWAVGRTFDKGVNVNKVPEIKLTTWLGVFSSAFCASLSHYYAEIKPLLPQMGVFNALNDFLEDRDDDLTAIHPVDPARVPNYAINMKDVLPDSCPESIHTLKDIELMDGGMSNNLPFYPLLRRNCDIIIALDSSADIDATPWFERTEGYARQKGIKGWPMGAGWPSKEEIEDPKATAKALDDAQNMSRDDAERHRSSAQEVGDKIEEEGNARGETDAESEIRKKKYLLGPCSIWVGQAEGRTLNDHESQDSNGDHGKAKEIAEEWHTITQDTGLMLIYLPLIPHKDVPHCDPAAEEWLSTWNFVYSEDQIDRVSTLARTNYDEGRERIRRSVKAMYERKRDERLRKEEAKKDAKRT